MYYSDDLVEQVRNANDIVDVVSRYVTLKKKGESHFGLCPFHSEKTESFSVSRSKQMFYCFGCHVGGNVFTFLMKYENYSFVEAMQNLAENAGISLPESGKGEDSGKSLRKKRLFEVNKAAATYYYMCLRSDRGKRGMDYLTSRALDTDTINRFGLGYSGRGGNEVVSYLKSKGFEQDIIRDAGLANFNEQRGLSDRFWNRVMFPIQDPGGHVIGFGGRVMGDGDPKYLNSPETEIFDKGRNLYGLNIARNSRENYFILCEGYMDVIAQHQAGFGQAVASLGTAFTVGQAFLIKKYVKRVLLAYDSDAAGTRAAIRALGILRDAGLDASVIDLRPYKDPDEFVKNLGPEEYRKRLAEAENGFLFEIRVLCGEFDMNDPASKTNFHREVASRLAGFEEEVERENYIEAVNNKYNIGYENLRRLVQSAVLRGGENRNAYSRPKTTTAQKAEAQADRKKRPQRFLLGWLGTEPDIYRQIKNYISQSDFTEEPYIRLSELMFKSLEAGEEIVPAMLVSMFEDEDTQNEVGRVFSEYAEMIAENEDKGKMLGEILLAVKENSYHFLSENAGADMDAMKRILEEKKKLEELKKVRF